MDPILVATLTLRGISEVMKLQGRPEVGNAIEVLLAAHQAGRNVDAHMKHIATLLQQNAPLADWETITARINEVTAQFLDDDGA